MKRYYAILALYVLVGLSQAHAQDRIPETTRDAAFYIKATFELTVRDGSTTELLTTAFAGSSVCITPEGHLATCRHVANPQDCIGQFIAEENAAFTHIDRIVIRYRVENAVGQTFYTDYEPSFSYSTSGSTSFGFTINSLESRPGYEENKRHLRLVRSSTLDLMLFKIEHATPLPYMTLPKYESDQLPDRLYALSCRLGPDSTPVVATRVGVLASQELIHTNDCAAHDLLMTTIPGDSGSAVVDNLGRVWGIAFCNDDPTMGGDHTYMLPYECIKAILGQDRLQYLESVEAEAAVAPSPPAE